MTTDFRSHSVERTKRRSASVNPKKRRLRKGMTMAFLGSLLLLCFAWGRFGNGAKAELSEEDFARLRRQMVNFQLIRRDIVNKRVLEAMAKVCRHRFVSATYRENAYDDRPLPIGYGQTISQPYIVALMTQLVRIEAEDRILEVGTGSGYQAAVLAELAKEVYTVEIIEPLADRAREQLKELGYENVTLKVGDGYLGWEEHAPFDAIIVTAAPEKIPPPLLEQLTVGGYLVIPVGDEFQELELIRKTQKGFDRRSVTGVRFVPMTGKAEERGKKN